MNGFYMHKTNSLQISAYMKNIIALTKRQIDINKKTVKLWEPVFLNKITFLYVNRFFAGEIEFGYGKFSNFHCFLVIYPVCLFVALFVKNYAGGSWELEDNHLKSSFVPFAVSVFN